MTGFGRAHRDVGAARITCEVRTLNHKGLDVRVRVPHGVSALEHEVVAAAKRSLERGRVEISFEVFADAPGIDAAAARSFVEQARALAQSLGVAGDVTAGDVLRVVAAGARRDPGLDAEAAAAPMASALLEALDACVAARTAEGQALAKVVEQRLSAVEALAQRLRVRTADAPARLAEKLRVRLEAAGNAGLDAARVAQEAALLADRVDVTEELERLVAHVEQARALVASPSPGRKLDFLCQELLREANTLGSKCQDAPAAHLVVELKAEIEKMREQVQNVE